MNQDIEKFDSEYKDWLIEIKSKVRVSQIKVALSANAELILFYWELGKMIVEKQKETNWGDKLTKQLSKDLQDEFPEMGGFSVTNLKYCRQFYLFYSLDLSIGQQPVDQLQSGKEITNTVFKNNDYPIGQQPVAQLSLRHNILSLPTIEEIENEFNEPQK